MQTYNTQTVTTAAALGIGAKTLKGFILFGGSGATSVQFKNAATDTGTVLLSANVGAAETKVIDLESLGGMYFSTGCFCKPAGTGAICYCWFGG